MHYCCEMLQKTSNNHLDEPNIKGLNMAVKIQEQMKNNERKRDLIRHIK